MGKNGGARPGAGRKKGGKNQSTLEKEAARNFVREYVTRRLEPILEAQVDSAIGIKHLMLRDPKTGKFDRVKDEKGIDDALKSEGEATWIYTKDPSTQAAQDLLNRAIDKPKEQEQEIKVTGTLNIESRIKAGRERLAKRG